jgi:hypothetical protein
VSCLNAEEIAIISRIFNIVFGNYTARQITRYSHGGMYELCDLGEEMPYFLIYVDQPGEITPEDLAWAERCHGQKAAG